MFLKLFVLAVAISASSLAARRTHPVGHNCNNKNNFNEFDINEGIGYFGVNLFKKLFNHVHDGSNPIALNTGENILFSPISIYYSLALAHLGAGGHTRYELSRVLDAPSDEPSIYKWHKSFSDIIVQLQKSKYTNVTVYNELFVQNGFHVKSQYADFIGKYYNSKVENVDFASSDVTDYINKWFASVTQGRIPHFYDVPLSQDVKLLLANALSFGGIWDQEFPVADTQSEYFRGEDGDEQKISMMHKTDKVLHYNDVQHGYEAIGIPYSNQEYYMYLILPSENTDLKHLIHEVITYEHIQHVVSQSQLKMVDIKLPSMKLKTSSRVKDVLSEMGVGHLFQAANWSNMLLESQLKVSEIWHYVEMEVNEKGSDISVGTTEEFKIYSPQTPVAAYQHQFYAQRPYLFFIYHPLTKTVIFYGSISTVTGWGKM